MSFGLCGAAQTFQRFVDQVFRGLTSKNGRKVKYFCYLNDILLASDNMQEHLEDVEALFKRLNEYGLKINLAKCVFQEKELQFLGHTITPKGISPQNSKVEAIRNFAKPVTLKDLRRYLGMIIIIIITTNSLRKQLVHLLLLKLYYQQLDRRKVMLS